MTFSEKQRKIRTAIRNGYHVIGHRKDFGENKWSAIYEDGGKLKYARGDAPELLIQDSVRVSVTIDIEHWTLDSQKEANRKQVA